MPGIRKSVYPKLNITLLNSDFSISHFWSWHGFRY
jgi:hypothetical protein